MSGIRVYGVADEFSRGSLECLGAKNSDRYSSSVHSKRMVTSGIGRIEPGGRRPGSGSGLVGDSRIDFDDAARPAIVVVHGSHLLHAG